MQLATLGVGVVFGLLGMAGNWLYYELCFNVNFLFGSVFVMFCLLRFGPVAGSVSGVIASLVTFLIWYHPRNIIIFSAEAIFVAYLHGRRRVDLLSAVVLYWILPGAALSWILYHGQMRMPDDAVHLLILKQVINGIMNALLAKCAYLVLASRRAWGIERPTFHEFITTAMLALVLSPALLYMIFEIRQEQATIHTTAQESTRHLAQLTRTTLKHWALKEHQTIKTLAAIVRPELQPEDEIQGLVESYLRSETSFKRIGIMNRYAISVAFAPTVNAQGGANRGLDFSSRPYLAVVRDQRQPYVGDVQMSRTGPVAPEVPFLAPILVDNDYKGYCAGIVDLSTINSILAAIVGSRGVTLTVRDRHDAVIASTDPALPVMAPWRQAQGEIRAVANGVSLWLPPSVPGGAPFARWYRSCYFREVQLSPEIGWSLRVESSLLPALIEISGHTNTAFSLMAAFIVAMTGVAFVVSRSQSRAVITLQELTARVARDPQAVVPLWPTSPILEVNALSRNLQQMAEELRGRIQALDHVNRHLDQLVQLRTEELATTNLRLLDSQRIAHLGSWELDLRSNTLTWSEEIFRIFEIDTSRFDASYEAFLTLVHPDDRARVNHAYEVSLASGRPYEISHRLLMADGRVKHVYEQGETDYDEEGVAIRTRGTVQDITARIEAEAELQESRELFALLMRYTPVYTFVKEIDNGVSRALAVSDNFKEMLGIPAASMIGKSMAELFPADFAKKITADDLAVVESGKNVELDETFNDRFYTTIKFPIIRPGRSTLLAGFTIDVTARKKMDLALRESEERYRNLVEHSAVWIWESDTTLRHTYSNAQVEEMLGYAADAFLSMDISELVHPDDRDVIRAVADRALAEKQPWQHVVLRWRHRNGGWRVLESSGTPYSDTDGSVRGLRGVDQDITERWLAQEALRELNRTLEARVEEEANARLQNERLLIQQSKMAAMGEMIGAIAHQWRQPLNAVGAIVQDIRSAFAAGILDRQYLQHSVEDAMQQLLFMSKTVNDFRNFFQPDKTREVFDAKQAMVEVMAMFNAQFKSHDIDWQLTCIPHHRSFGPGDAGEVCDAMTIFGFENELKQVFLNLINNARDAILEQRPGQGRGHIQVDFDRSGEGITIRVADNGTGVPSHLQDRIFEPYFTTKEQGQGTGIGLYMTKMIVENSMGGRITVTNRGAGGEFTIELPQGPGHPYGAGTVGGKPVVDLPSGSP